MILFIYKMFLICQALNYCDFTNKTIYPALLTSKAVSALYRQKLKAVLQFQSGYIAYSGVAISMVW